MMNEKIELIEIKEKIKRKEKEFIKTYFPECLIIDNYLFYTPSFQIYEIKLSLGKVYITEHHKLFDSLIENNYRQKLLELFMNNKYIDIGGQRYYINENIYLTYNKKLLTYYEKELGGD